MASFSNMTPFIQGDIKVNGRTDARTYAQMHSSTHA